MAASFSHKIAFTVAVAKALGLDPTKTPIRSIQIDAGCQGPATATVKFLIDVEADERIGEVVKRFKIEEPIEETTTWRDKEPLL